MLALLIITPLVFLSALQASTRRRRTLLQLAIGGMLGLIVIRRVMYWLQSDLIAAAKSGHRFVTLAMLALAFLTACAAKAPAPSADP